MRFNETTVRVLVRKNYEACFDFYTEKLGLVPTWGTRNGPYTSFAVEAGGTPCFAMFLGANMSKHIGYEQPTAATQPDSMAVILPTDDVDRDYTRLKSAGVEFLSEPQDIWGFRMVYFRDPEGNLFELMDGNV